MSYVYFVFDCNAFSFRRVPNPYVFEGALLYCTQNYKEAGRSTVLDTASEDGLRQLSANIASTARALAAHVYNLTDDSGQEDALYDDVLVRNAQSMYFV